MFDSGILNRNRINFKFASVLPAKVHLPAKKIAMLEAAKVVKEYVERLSLTSDEAFHILSAAELGFKAIKSLRKHKLDKIAALFILSATHACLGLNNLLQTYDMFTINVALQPLKG